jgi:hypothetical protein
LFLAEPAAISVSDLFSSSLEHIFVQHEHALNQILNRVLLAGHTTAPPSKNPDVSFNEITFVNSATASSALNTPQFTAVQHALFPPAALNELALPSVTDSDFVITTSHASQNTLLRFISLFRSFFLQERADLMSGFVESFFDQVFSPVSCVWVVFLIGRFIFDLSCAVAKQGSPMDAFGCVIRDVTRFDIVIRAVCLFRSVVTAFDCAFC